MELAFYLPDGVNARKAIALFGRALVGEDSLDEDENEEGRLVIH
jgi:hypothetical protein